MRILFICNQFPYPPLSGMRRKILTFAKYLKKGGDEIYLFSLTPPERDFENHLFKEIIIAKTQGCISKSKHVLRYFLKKPIQISMYIAPENIRMLKRYINRIKPDAVFIDYIRSGDFGININLPKIINYDDPQSLKFSRMKEFLSEIKNPFGEGINFIPEVLKKLLCLKPCKKLILSYEINTLRKYETRISKHYPVILTNSIEDARYLRKNGVKNIDFLPPLIDREYYLPKLKAQKENIITFIGKMDYPPNPHAVEHFTNKILPEIKKYQKNSLEFRIIGANTPSWLHNICNSCEDIKIIGEVEDIRPYLQESTVFVAPLKFGTGIKVKIIEAMASEVPVVTTSVGIQGMRVKNGVHAIVEDEPEKFARGVIKLLNNRDLRKKIARVAKKYVFEEFNAEKYVKNIREYLKDNQK